MCVYIVVSESKMLNMNIPLYMYLYLLNSTLTITVHNYKIIITENIFELDFGAVLKSIIGAQLAQTCIVVSL